MNTTSIQGSKALFEKKLLRAHGHNEDANKTSRETKRIKKWPPYRRRRKKEMEKIAYPEKRCYSNRVNDENSQKKVRLTKTKMALITLESDHLHRIKLKLEIDDEVRI